MSTLFGTPAAKPNAPLWGQSSSQSSGFLTAPDQNPSNPLITPPLPSTSVFGTPTATNKAASLWGNNGSGFGNTNQTANTNTSSAPTIGNNNNQSPSGWGNTNTQSTTPGWGGTNNTQSSTPSLFGSTTNNNQQQPTGSLFGNTNQQQPSGSLFGNTSTSNNSPWGNTNTNKTSLFGNTTNNNNNQQPTNSIFGNTSTNNNTTSLFGNTSTNNNNNNSVFGNTTNNNSLFKPTNSSIFGGANNNNNSLFGASHNSTTLGGSTNSNLLGSSVITTQRRITQNEESIESKIMKIYNAWNLTHPNCAFQYFFYNLVEPEDINRYVRPSLATDESKWQKAKRLNPDPNRMVPTIAIGFEDLGKRLQAQRSMAKLHIQKLEEVEGRVNDLTHKLNLTTIPKLHKINNAQAVLTTRLIRLISRLPINIEEDQRDTEQAVEALIRRTDHVRERLRACGGRARVGELWAGFKMSAALTGGPGGSGDELEVGRWSVADEREIKKVLEILVSQQKGIDHLRSVLENARSDIRVMAQAFQIESI